MAKGSMTGIIIAVIIVLVSVGAVFGFAAGRMLQMTAPLDIKAQTDAQSFCVDKGDQFEGRGLYNDADTDANRKGELFTQSTIYYSHDPGGLSQEIVGEGAYVNCGSVWIRGSPDFGRYFFYINNGEGFKKFYQDDIPNAVYQPTLDISSFGGASTPRAIGLFSLKIDGFDYCTVPITIQGQCSSTEDIVDGAVLRVDLEIEQKKGPLGIGGWAMTIMRDELKLRSALATVDFDKDGYTIPSDPVAIVRWEAPSATYQTCNTLGECTTRPAYFIEVINRNTNFAVPGGEKQPILTARGQLVINLDEAMVSNDLATCDNELEAILYTEIDTITEDFSAIRTVTQAGSAPTIVSFTMSPTDIREGETVTITWMSAGNVTAYFVKVYISGQAVIDVKVEPTAKSYVFQAQESGQGRAWVSAANRCSFSNEKQINFFVGNAPPNYCALFPTAADCVQFDLIALIILLVVIVGLTSLFIVIFWVTSKVVKSGFIAFIISIVVVAAVAIGVILAGWLDAPFLALGAGVIR